MFTSIFRRTFPGAIYLNQELKFKKPICRDENVEGKIEVEAIRTDKKIVTFRTTITKDNGDVAVDGKAVLIIPHLKI
jgi:3-hydroxybutyryl-CoA dehydratase